MLVKAPKKQFYKEILVNDDDEMHSSVSRVNLVKLMAREHPRNLFI